jgi:glycosyltransferase involved in cell wall biosynthesis
MIPTYNCGRYLRATIESVLAQDPGAGTMQIEVIDDASATDDPAVVVLQVGAGRVGFFRQEANVGHTRNFETCLQRARGKLVHLLHGDDLVKDGFYRRIQYAFEARPEIGAAFCRYEAIDENDAHLTTARLEQDHAGVIDGWLERIGAGQRLQTPCMVVRRDVYEHLGGFDERLRGAEDWEMWVRIAAHYPVWYEPQPLAVYRLHSGSKSQRSVRSGANVESLRLAIDINRAHLPRETRERITRLAERNCAKASLRRAARFARAGDTEAARAQRQAAWGTDPSFAIAMASLPVYLAQARAVVGRPFRKLRGLATRRTTTDEPTRIVGP